MALHSSVVVSPVFPTTSFSPLCSNHGATKMKSQKVRQNVCSNWFCGLLATYIRTEKKLEFSLALGTTSSNILLALGKS